MPKDKAEMMAAKRAVLAQELADRGLTLEKRVFINPADDERFSRYVSRTLKGYVPKKKAAIKAHRVNKES
jgi:hypothetical protein